MPQPQHPIRHSLVLGSIGALIAGLFVWLAGQAVTEWTDSSAADNYYNLQVEGFQHGHLYLNKEVPAGFKQLPDPYDPQANQEYRLPASWHLHDMSYYQGRLYLYFGVTPTLLLFWPWAVLTGHYLPQRIAVALFCAAGFFASAGLLRAIWRRYFPTIGIVVVSAGVLALGLAAGVPILLQRAEFWEVPVSCGYALSMLALGAIWLALHDPVKRGWWLAAASLTLGLAIGARPNLAPGTVVLLVPLVQAWRESSRTPTSRGDWKLIVATVLPLLFCGLGLMLYNDLRFHHPFEFGQTYQLAGDRQDAVEHFSLRYLGFNLRCYFLEPARWSHHFPFVHYIAKPPVPPQGHAPLDDAGGLLPNIPLVWLTLAAPLVWRGQGAADRSQLRGFIVALIALIAGCALPLCLFYGNCFRYEMEFLPALVLLAVIGLLALENTLAGQPRKRLAFRIAAGFLLAFSLAFNLLAATERYARHLDLRGDMRLVAGDFPGAAQFYQAALRWDPDITEAEYYLGNIAMHSNRPAEAVSHYETALRLDPERVDAHYSLGVALTQLGRNDEAITHFEAVIRLNPDYADARYNLGYIYAGLGRWAEAVPQLEAAVRLNPDDAEARTQLEQARQHAASDIVR